MNSVYISVFEKQRYKHSDEYSNAPPAHHIYKRDGGTAVPPSLLYGIAYVYIIMYVGRSLRLSPEVAPQSRHNRPRKIGRTYGPLCHPAPASVAPRWRNRLSFLPQKRCRTYGSYRCGKPADLRPRSYDAARAAGVSPRAKPECVATRNREGQKEGLLSGSSYRMRI